MTISYEKDHPRWKFWVRRETLSDRESKVVSQQAGRGNWPETPHQSRIITLHGCGSLQGGTVEITEISDFGDANPMVETQMIRLNREQTLIDGESGICGSRYPIEDERAESDRANEPV